MQIKRRALVAEDSPGWIELAEITLAGMGFEVKTATDYNSAIALLKKELFHIALVDLELGLPVNNYFGMDILKDIDRNYPDCYRLIYTIHAQDKPDKVINCLSVPNPIAHGCFMKETQTRITDLTDFINKMWDKFAKINYKIEIIPEGFNLEEILRKKFKKEEPEIIRDSFLSVMGKLFYGNSGVEKIILTLFKEGFSNTILFKTTVQSSLLKNRPGKQVIIKFGSKDIILKESSNYDKFVQWYLTLNQSIQKLSYEELNNYAALLYTFAGDSPSNIQTFADYVKGKDENKDQVINNCISAMFNPERRDWYSPTVVERSEVIRDYYIDSVLHRPPSKLSNIFHTEILKARKANIGLRDDSKKLHFTDYNLTVLNPYHFCQANPFLDQYTTCIIHGDFNGDNIIIDSNKNWYLIDYAHTGRGHVFQDFINLELSIRHIIFWDSGISFSLKEIFDFEKSIINVFDPYQEKEISIEKEDKHYYLKKAKYLIWLIRSLAAANFPTEPNKLYLVGLFYMTLDWTAFHVKGGIEEKKHFIILAGLLSEYFEKLKTPRTLNR
jgi:CheY-like chemotaxis protein